MTPVTRTEALDEFVQMLDVGMRKPQAEIDKAELKRQLDEKKAENAGLQFDNAALNERLEKRTDAKAVYVDAGDGKQPVRHACPLLRTIPF